MSQINIELLPINSIEPNPWNPNVQNEAQYKAEIESITTNGFLAPILVRAIGKKYQVIDGEHRLRALTDIFENGIEGVGNVPELAEAKQIPAIVISASDAHAKKLTIIMNETRGRADMAKLGALLADIKLDLGDDLRIGLPYTNVQLQELIDMGSFDWSALDIPVEDVDFENDDEDGKFKVAATLNNEYGLRWKALLAENKTTLPKDPKLAAGEMIIRLMEGTTNGN